MLATARAAPVGDTAPWDRALTAARGADTLARAGEADADSRARAESLLREIERDSTAAHEAAERDAKDRAMVERLQEIRGTEQDPGFTTFDDFAAAYADYGIDVLSLPIEDSVGRFKASAIRDALAMGLDYWSAIDETRKARLLQIARAADPDPWRTKLRDAKSGEELRALAAGADPAIFPIEAMLEVVYALASRESELDAAIATAEKVAFHHPDDFSIQMALADVLSRPEPPRTEEALRHVSAAIALRPRSWNAWRRAGFLFSKARRLPETIDSLQRAVDLRPNDVLSHLSLGYALATARRWPEAERACSKALELRMRGNQANTLMMLGLVCTQLGQHERAVESLRASARLFSTQPGTAAGDFVKATSLLAFALLRAGDLDQALVEADRAIGVDAGDRSAFAHDVRGVVKIRRGDLAGGRASLELSVKLDPFQPEPWNDLGELELTEGRLPEAIAAFRESVKQDAN